MTNEEWIAKARAVHGDKYDYSLVDFPNKTSNKGKFICHAKDGDGVEHGVFEQDYTSHLGGCGCPKCNGGVKHDKDMFVTKARKVHGEKYGYDHFVYKNAHTKGLITCKVHGDFEQEPDAHLRGEGCPLCSHEGKEYKEFGYWNDYDHCVEEAKKYRNKKQLMVECIGCYGGLKRNGWLDEVAEKYFDSSPLYMGYEEKKNAVYVYEFPEFNTFYVGRTNNIKRRHQQHTNGSIHSNGKVAYDGVFAFANEKGIPVPEPKILETELNAEESQEFENYWKETYINNGWTTLNKATTGKGRGSLGATMKWTYDKAKEEASKYQIPKQLQNNSPGCYSACYRNGWFDDFFPNRKKYKVIQEK